MKETIIRNTKVLGMNNADALYVENMEYVNNNLPISAMDVLFQFKGTEFIVADGYIVGVN